MKMKINHTFKITETERKDIIEELEVFDKQLKAVSKQIEALNKQIEENKKNKKERNFQK